MLLKKEKKKTSERAPMLREEQGWSA